MVTGGHLHHEWDEVHPGHRGLLVVSDCEASWGGIPGCHCCGVRLLLCFVMVFQCWQIWPPLIHCPKTLTSLIPNVWIDVCPAQLATLFNVVCCNHAGIVYEFGKTSRCLLICNWCEIYYCARLHYLFETFLRIHHKHSFKLCTLLLRGNGLRI